MLLRQEEERMKNKLKREQELKKLNRKALWRAARDRIMNARQIEKAKRRAAFEERFNRRAEKESFPSSSDSDESQDNEPGSKKTFEEVQKRVKQKAHKRKLKKSVHQVHEF